MKPMVVLFVAFLTVAACDKGKAGPPKQSASATAGEPAAAGSAASNTAAPAQTVDVAPTPVTATTPGQAAAAIATEALKVGDRVQAQWTNGRWYPGRIVAVRPDGTYDVNYDDGDKSRALAPSKVKRKETATDAAASEPLAVGDRVQARWTNGRWYPGKIVAIQADGSYDVNYDDGDKSRGLPATKVRRPAAKTSSGGHKSSGTASNASCSGPGMMRRCNGKCVNIQEDNNNCGSCGNVCRSGYHCDGHMFCRDANGNL